MQKAAVRYAAFALGLVLLLAGASLTVDAPQYSKDLLLPGGAVVLGVAFFGFSVFIGSAVQSVSGDAGGLDVAGDCGGD